jgi:hypothetical protein
MLPALLALPWAVEACTTLMVWYVVYGPEIMAALTETPCPMAPARSLVAQTAAGHAGPVSQAARAAAMNWWTRFSRHLSPDQMSEAAQVVASTKRNAAVLNQHIETHSKFLHAPPAGPTIGRDITHEIAGRSGVPAEWFPMVLKPLSSGRGADLLKRHNLSLVKKHGAEFWELERHGTHVAFMPGSIKTPAQFEHWLADIVHRHNL